MFPRGSAPVCATGTACRSAAEFCGSCTTSRCSFGSRRLHGVLSVNPCETGRRRAQNLKKHKVLLFSGARGTGSENRRGGALSTCNRNIRIPFPPRGCFFSRCRSFLDFSTSHFSMSQCGCLKPNPAHGRWWVGSALRS